MMAEMAEMGRMKVVNSRIETKPFYNAHTHAAMFKLRNSAEGLELHRWLKEKVWPVESKLTEEDVYWGCVLSFIEMVRSAQHLQGRARAFEESV